MRYKLALNFTRQDGDDAVKFTEFEVKSKHVGKSSQTKARETKFNRRAPSISRHQIYRPNLTSR